MALNIETARIDVWQTGSDSIDRVVPGGVIQNVSISKRIQNWEDSATIDIDNKGGAYTGGVTPGDKLSFYVSTVNRGGTEQGDDLLGQSRYGESTYGGGVLPVSDRWRGWAHQPSIPEEGAGDQSMSVPASDWVFEQMNNRDVYEDFNSRPIAGDGGIVNELVARYAPAVDSDLIEPTRQTTSLERSGEDLLDVILDLAERADAVVASFGESLIFQPVSRLKPRFTLRRDVDCGPMELGGQSDSIVNHVRVDGGWDSDIDENTAPNGQSDIDDYYRVTDSDRLYYPLDPAKTTLDSADVWMRSQSEDSLRVRIQSANDDNTGPRNPENDGPDLVADNSGDAVANDGWRENFRFERYPLTSNPWLIIEASGEEGHDIGIVGYDSDDNPIPAFRTHYPFRILLNDSEQASIEQFGRRDGTLERDTIPDYDTARELADSYLRHNAWPERTIQFEALSVRAHTLEPGELVTVENPDLNVNGDWIVSERSDEYNGQSSRLHTTITLQDPRSF